MTALGRSSTAKFYGIADLNEAKAYLRHPVLRARLIEICRALLEQPADDVLRVMGAPDHLKLCSSMTLFRCADPSIPEFGQVLDRFYRGVPDSETLRLPGM